jgi:mannose/fructose/N-acetylgalactosamine-specific phosphotransferase system component IIB
MTPIYDSKANDEAVLNYFVDYIAKNSVSPSLRETAKNCGVKISYMGVDNVVHRLQRNGRMRRLKSLRYVPVTTEDVRRMRKLKQQGVDLFVIGEEFGMSARAVQTACAPVSRK